jgi:hypothetical protein
MQPSCFNNLHTAECYPVFLIAVRLIISELGGWLIEHNGVNG